MRKIFSLFLTLSLLFLTACNTPPKASSNSDNQEQPTGAFNPEDVIVANSTYNKFIDLPSRIIFYAQNALGQWYNMYYSKADGNVYLYCFDPFCDHSGGECLANPSDLYDQQNLLKDRIDIDTIRFINGRFYAVAYNSGRILSFNFDGIDMQLEYDGDYPIEVIHSNGAWMPKVMSYGPYLYIDHRADTSDDGKKHILRFNTETKEMEDLTEQTGRYAWPSFFYNGEMYARTETGDPVKASPDLTVYEETVPLKTFYHFYGSSFIYSMYDDDYNPLGIGIYDMATGEDKKVSNEKFGFSEKGISIIEMDENYIYFVDAEEVVAGYKLHPKTGKKYAVTKNDGKLYRMDHDGTNIVCIYDDPSIGFSYYDAIVFDGNTIIINATKYRSVEGDTEGLVETYAGGYYVGKFGEDGMVEELKPIEFVG